MVMMPWLPDLGTPTCHGVHVGFEFRSPTRGSENDFVAEFDITLRTCRGQAFAVLREWALLDDGRGSYYMIPPGAFLQGINGKDEYVEYSSLAQEREQQAIAAYKEWAASRGPKAMRPTKEVPCDCPGGPCGTQHVVPAGPPRYYLDGRKVSEAEYRATRAEIEKKSAGAGGVP